MPLCERCHQNAATVHFVKKVDDVEKVNVHLCEECARPTMAKQEARRQGRQKCEFCRGAAYAPIPVVRNVIYGCCGCRAEYARVFFELCTVQRPDLVHRSKGDISFFDLCFDPEVEAWAEIASQEAIQKLRDYGQQNGSETIS